jgi:uncharacterized circularly permuted ATP-grasp superfamily protein/predicted Zn-dependent protease
MIRIKKGDLTVLATRLMNLRIRTKNRVNYKPNKGYIGKYEVDVANYIFSSKGKLGYTHSQSLVEAILGKTIQEHHQTSQRLTRFLKKRDLTFQKSDKDGVYRIFTVPVTTTVVPIPKSVFNEVEEAAQVLMVSLRKVLQSVYGAKTIRDSEFVRALPEGIQRAFLDATENSPHYIPQLHHENMREYPFLDNVGLDLVLIEAYFQKRGMLSKLIEENRTDELPELPFRVLELNAGSPSGASNNSNILEGILREDPAILSSLGKVIPNDHYEVLRRTYRSLGEGWTGRKDGVQVLLPPGGANGASPEIHQLAAYSGLIYCDPGQLFQDAEGWIRLRTVNGSDPVVTSIYSRVNSDSALFDREKGILLRDPENGDPIYCVDVLKPWKKGKPEYIRGEDGKPVPLESDYAIPGALDAIVNRKLYMGGLNRLLDNKIILATLTEYAPEFYRADLEKMGLNVEGARITPPECLPSKAESIDLIAKNPKDWVIKAPNLSGGTGVHILMTLDDKKRREVLTEAKKAPETFAYQRVVRIGRIPVAVRQNGGSGYRFANLAADIRMWVFYGANDTLPTMTHNALVRYAPKEKGPMSSIVNTSKGGGYAPFVVTDDMNSPNAVSANEAAVALEPVPFQASLPAFVGAQMVQVANIVHELRTLVRQPNAELYRISGYLYSLKLQVREIASFIHPRSMETIYSMIEVIEKRIDSKTIAAYYLKMNQYQARLVSLLQQLDSIISADFYLVLDELNVLNQDVLNRGYTYEMKRMDLFNFGHLSYLIRNMIEANPKARKNLNRLRSMVKEMITQKFPVQPMNVLVSQRLESLLDQFCDLAARRLKNSIYAVEFASLFEDASQQSQLLYRETFMTSHDGQAPRSATEWEMTNERRLSESEYVDADVQAARQDWLKVMQDARKLPAEEREGFLRLSRKEHFLKHPRMKELQALVDRRDNADFNAIIALMSVMPYAAYNLRQYAIEKGVQFNELFTNQLMAERISILDRQTRLDEKLNLDQYSGECFAKKRARHGLISNSDRYMWVGQEQSPLIQLYTIGHELIHAGQIKEVMDMETQSITEGSLSFARFLNYYGNFMSLAAKSLESHQADQTHSRKPVYGLADRMVSQFFTPVIQNVREGLAKSTAVYEQQLNKYGSLFGYMMPVSNAVRVKALREVIPALENAKNIIFAKECGLEIQLDEVRSALPIANKIQVKRHRALITEAARDWKLNFEALRVIASHQYYGVMFSRNDDASQNLTIDSDPAPIFLNTGYNQTQQ